MQATRKRFSQRESEMTYLEMLRARYAGLRAQIEEIQARAIADNQRDFTADELRAITEAGAAAEALVPTIEAAAAEQARNARVDAAAGSVAADVAAAEQARAAAANGAPTGQAGAGASQGGEHSRSGGPGHVPGQQVGAATTQDRDPGHYTRAKGGYFRDIVRAREGDRDAQQRLEEHNRALSTGVAGAGIVPPKWLTEEYESLARQGRVVSQGVRQIALTDPAPMTLPRQTTGTDAVIAELSTENTHPSETDAVATTTDVVTPKATSGIQVVSRQMIDSTNPAVDELIYGDMFAVYNRKVEDKVTAALVAAAGAAVVTFATEAAFLGTLPAVPAVSAITKAAIAVWNARKLPATQIAMRVSRWGAYVDLRDSGGRDLIPTQNAGPMNVDGVGSVEAAGSIKGLPVLVTDGLGIGGATYPEDILVYRASDTILFEGSLMRFRYEEIAGPESIKLGVWAYTAVIVRQAANSVRRIRITAA